MVKKEVIDLAVLETKFTYLTEQISELKAKQDETIKILNNGQGKINLNSQTINNHITQHEKDFKRNITYISIAAGVITTIVNLAIALVPKLF